MLYIFHVIGNTFYPFLRLRRSLHEMMPIVAPFGIQLVLNPSQITFTVGSSAELACYVVMVLYRVFMVTL